MRNIRNIILTGILILVLSGCESQDDSCSVLTEEINAIFTEQYNYIMASDYSAEYKEQAVSLLIEERDHKIAEACN